eukprot:gene10188-biopygen217
MSRGCSPPESSWNRCRSLPVCIPNIMPIPRFARDRQLRFQLDSVREQPPRDMSYGGIDEMSIYSQHRADWEHNGIIYPVLGTSPRTPSIF